LILVAIGSISHPFYYIHIQIFLTFVGAVMNLCGKLVSSGPESSLFISGNDLIYILYISCKIVNLVL